MFDDRSQKFTLSPPPYRSVPPSIGLYELLNFFQTGRSHLVCFCSSPFVFSAPRRLFSLSASVFLLPNRQAIVTDHTREYQWSMSTGEDVAGYCRIQGIVTLEDVIEQVSFVTFCIVALFSCMRPCGALSLPLFFAHHQFLRHLVFPIHIQPAAHQGRDR
jgi:hypothetical protein